MAARRPTRPSAPAEPGSGTAHVSRLQVLLVHKISASLVGVQNRGGMNAGMISTAHTIFSEIIEFPGVKS